MHNNCIITTCKTCLCGLLWSIVKTTDLKLLLLFCLHFLEPVCGYEYYLYNNPLLQTFISICRAAEVSCGSHRKSISGWFVVGLQTTYVLSNDVPVTLLTKLSTQSLTLVETHLKTIKTETETHLWHPYHIQALPDVLLITFGALRKQLWHYCWNNLHMTTMEHNVYHVSKNIALYFLLHLFNNYS